MIVKFQHYMHASKEVWYEDVEDALEEAGITGDAVEAIRQSAQFPFYEIGFDCELDTETGEVHYSEVTS